MELLRESWNIFVALAPWLLLGMAVAGLVHVLMPQDFLRRHLRGRSGVFKAVALGVPLPLCSCGVIPAGLGLKKDGASDGASVGFLISTPQTGVDSILVSASFLGWPFAIFKVFAAFITGIIGGLLTDAWSASEEVSPQELSSPENQKKRSVRDGLEHALQILDTIWLWLLFGIFASAALSLWVPTDFFLEMSTWGSLTTMFAVLLVSLPLYVCATSSVPIAAALVAGGLPAGSALVFLMAGPATNIATMGALYKAFGRKTTAIYLCTIIVFSITFGLLFDALLQKTDLTITNPHEHHSWWMEVSAWILTAIMGYLTIEKIKQWTRRDSDSAGAMVIPVGGMTCNGCVNRLQSQLSARDDIEYAQVNLEPGQAIVRGDIHEAELRLAIEEIGFEAL
jgi:uncharacterized membrane protein YraQ (UPF0718 family)/copper chaperone CopZ